MSVLRITSAAILLAQQASRSAAAARDAELHGCLADLVVYLGVLKVQCAALVHETRPPGDDDVGPTAIVGA
jgi:hypothetical protein